jgi:hypothetical protein
MYWLQRLQSTACQNADLVLSLANVSGYDILHSTAIMSISISIYHVAGM